MRSEHPLLDFLKWACGRVQQQGKRNVLCIQPQTLPSYDRNMIRSLRESGLRNLGTGLFWFLRRETFDDAITRFGDLVIPTTRDCGIDNHVWIQGFQVPSGRESEITEAIVAASRLMPEVIAIWGFEGCAAMSSLACERPDVAWRCFLRGMEIVRS
jgi:hypothetical protein